ncbi:hypothetical protein LINPERHAP2_LOCUS37435 [Linum perenne]
MISNGQSLAGRGRFMIII